MNTPITPSVAAQKLSRQKAEDLLKKKKPGAEEELALGGLLPAEGVEVAAITDCP